MRSVLEAGFIFWGLFLVFGLILVAYILWMGWVEKQEKHEEDHGGEGPGP